MLFSAENVRLKAENASLRERLGEKKDEIDRLSARIVHLETLLDKRSVDVLNTVLHKQGYAAVGEEAEEEQREPLPFGHDWGATDQVMYENWERDFLIACPEKNKEDARRLFQQEYGTLAPRLALL